jgi:hypothetical protein
VTENENLCLSCFQQLTRNCDSELHASLLPFNQEKQISLFPEKFHPKGGLPCQPFSSRGRCSAVPQPRKELKTMATESQTNANRENAKASTGPQTAEGKAKSSRNNTKFGLFAVSNCVLPEEQEAYENFCSKLWTALAPADPIEEITAAEFIRNAWRLRRCAMAEETLGEIVVRFQASQNKTRGTDHPAADPMIYPAYLPAQTAIDRARTSAQNGMYRAKADLDKMQAGRKAQPSTVLQVEPKSAPVAEPAPTIRTQSHPSKPAQQERPNLCPCNSGREFIDCCAAGDGPASQKAA